MKHPFAIITSSFVVGMIAGVFTTGMFDRPISMSVERDAHDTYQFINPLLTCDDGPLPTLQNDRANELKEKLNQLAATLKENGTLTDGAIYFRELNDGPWVGVNQDAQFAPSSLLKVPLAMSVYKVAESDPAFLEKTVVYEGPVADTPVQHFPAPAMEKGRAYTVDELVREMLVNSSNDAAYLLADLIGERRLDETYSHLGIKAPKAGSDYTTNILSYGSFFRILFNGTYLSHDYSERLLSVLADSAFDQGMEAGLPDKIVAAHKFGERALQGSDTVQLHDCGIVYVPGKPYLLCVMLRGHDFDALAKAISEVSKVAYHYAK